MRGATETCRCGASSRHISIHAPHARSDQRGRSLLGGRAGFQSTLLMRGATACLLLSRISPQHFNPRSSCEERLTAISAAMPTVIFQSTLLMRGATWVFIDIHKHRNISIHAPHARSDARVATPLTPIQYFNPRSSCEERRAKLHSQFAAGMTFQSTLLMRGATCRLEIDAIFDSISIHAPHARSDTPLRISIWNIRLYFNPRSSCEERPPCFTRRPIIP